MFVIIIVPSINHNSNIIYNKLTFVFELSALITVVSSHESLSSPDL